MRVFLVVLLTAGALHAQQVMQDLPLPAGALSQLLRDTSIEFAMVPRVETESPYVIDVAGDGTGSIRFERDTKVTIPIKVSDETLRRLERGAQAVDKKHCETKLKNIARTGKKTISYALGPSTPRSCSFDYSDDEGLMDAVAAFQALVETVHYGERLQQEHRFDRLSLDAEVQSLTAEVAAGRAIEVGNIAPVLQSIVDDERVIDRARRNAARLLEKQ
jgi:hypothetical protein